MAMAARKAGIGLATRLLFTSLYAVGCAQAVKAGPVKAPKVKAPLAELGKRLFFDPRLSGDPRGCAGLINVVTTFPRSHHLHAAKELRCLDRNEVVDALLREARAPDNPALRPFILEAIEQLYV